MSNVPATKNDIRSLIQSEGYQKQFRMALPKHLTAERLTRVALTAMTKTPKLASCSQASLMSCILDCAQLGLEPDGRRAHLIPYGQTCTLIIDYKGLVELAMRSGMVSHIHADLICDNDEYEENMGRVVKHKINRRQDRGDSYAAYSHVVMKDGTESFEIMGVAEINAIKKRSASGSKGPWVTDWGEMAKKTVFRRHSKWLPLSPEFRDALDKDDTMPRDINAEVEVSAPVIDSPSVESGKPVERMDTPAPKARKSAPKKEKAPEPEPEIPDSFEPEDGAEPEQDDDTPDGGPFAAPTARDLDRP